MMNTFLETGHIELWIVLLGLILPRLALFLAWAGLGVYPANPLSDIVNFVLWLVFPRFLIAFYIYTDIGMSNLWFWLYIVLGITGLMGETGYARRRIIRRTTVRRDDGSTVTTVEEEE